jgi:[ribosomal protein S5]-alanine N-acetyltransferase
VINDLLVDHERGGALPHVVLNDDEIVGAITLSGIVRGPFLSGNLDWIDADHNGRGLATAAAAEIISIAFEFGLAPNYLKIAGCWQDHVLFQMLNSGP